MQKVTVFTPDGLGFGDGAIQVHSQLQTGELTKKGLAAAHELITTNGNVFTTIDSKITDDGCGDGRPAIDTWITTSDGSELHYKKSYARAKVFGGGLVVASSMWRAIAGTPSAQDTVLHDRSFIAQQLAAHDVRFGGHSDTHAKGEACGCGAIDRYKDMSYAITTYRDEITVALRALYGASFDGARLAIAKVFNAYVAINNQPNYYSDVAGSRTMQLMRDSKVILKQLEGGHQEDVIILNDIVGTTFDQPKFDELLKSKGINETIQAFVVDIWRARMYATVVAMIAQEHGFGSDEHSLTQIAYADFLIRTLAVAATLTAGDLPVYARMRAGRQDFAFI
ncbi:hypothetical protein EOL96_02320 [Candidatus Saccharibacteria bacterium]|nr:hypothetical protein [Candidatus Saccharibacteria bacterium]